MPSTSYDSIIVTGNEGRGMDVIGRFGVTFHSETRPFTRLLNERTSETKLIQNTLTMARRHRTKVAAGNFDHVGDIPHGNQPRGLIGRMAGQTRVRPANAETYKSERGKGGRNSDGRRARREREDKGK